MMERRKNYFIKKKFQVEFFIKFIMLIFVEAVMIGGLFMFVARDTLTTVYGIKGLTIESTNTHFFTTFLSITLAVGLAVALAGIFVFIFLTHRIGGPLYRIEKTLLEARDGNLAQRVQLRQTDQLEDLRDHLNMLLEAVDANIGKAKKDIDESIDLVVECTGNQEDTKIRIEEILRNLKASLKYFKTSE